MDGALDELFDSIIPGDGYGPALAIGRRGQDEGATAMAVAGVTGHAGRLACLPDDLVSLGILSKSHSFGMRFSVQEKPK